MKLFMVLFLISLNAFSAENDINVAIAKGFVINGKESLKESWGDDSEKIYRQSCSLVVATIIQERMKKVEECYRGNTYGFDQLPKDLGRYIPQFKRIISIVKISGVHEKIDGEAIYWARRGYGYEHAYWNELMKYIQSNQGGQSNGLFVEVLSPYMEVLSCQSYKDESQLIDACNEYLREGTLITKF